MKKIQFVYFVCWCVLVLACSNEVYCQNTGIGIASPNVSAQLDITSNAKGVLMPRMPSAAIALIVKPAKGLLVYDSLTNKLMVNMGNAAVPDWQTIVGSSQWALAGNKGTSAANFIGTTDNQPLVFKVNNQSAGIIDSVTNTTSLGSYTSRNTLGTIGNTALGGYALSQDFKGFGFNTALGRGAMFTNTTGYYNTAAGYNTLFNNSSGSQNTALGSGALYDNTSGFMNTAIGMNAFYENRPPFQSTYSFNYNTAIGYQSLTYNFGSYNTVSGYKAGNGMGNGNTVNGDNSMPAVYSLQPANYNTVEGADCMTYFYQGDANTILGSNSFITDRDDQNRIFTTEQNTSVGSQCLFHTTNASGNTALGYNSGSYAHNGWYNCFIGASADAVNGNLYNCISLGHGATVVTASTVRVGNTGTTSIGGPVGWSTLSDGRVKKNIKENIPGLSFITKLRPVSYNINTDAMLAAISRPSRHGKEKPFSESYRQLMQAAYKTKEQIVYSGFVAQEVEQAAKSVNYNFSGVDTPNSSDDLYALRYDQFVVPLVKAVQELAAESNKIQTSTGELKTSYKEIMERLDALERKVK